MFYFHARISNEDSRISRLERLARERMPLSMNNKDLPSDVDINKDGVIKTKGGAVKLKHNGDINKVLDTKRNIMLPRGRSWKESVAVKVKSRSRNKGRKRHFNSSRYGKINKERLSTRKGRNEHLKYFTVHSTFFKNHDSANVDKASNVLINQKRIISAKSKENGHIFGVLRGKSVNTTPKLNVHILGAINAKGLSDIKEASHKVYGRTKDAAKTNNTVRRHVRPHVLPRQDGDKGTRFVGVIPGVFLYTAYLDERIGRYLRFISIAFREQELVAGQFVCHFSEGHYSVGKFYRTCEDHMLTYAAYIISCPVPRTVNSRSVFQNGVQVSNSSRLTHDAVKLKVSSYHLNKPKKQFSVCVPPLFGNVSADKIIEFIEVNKILGANHFTFYRESSTKDKTLTKVLNMYSRTGDATVLTWRLPIRAEDIWYHGQSVSVWDCLFRNMHAFNYIAFNDIDEVIVPKVVKKWRTMIDTLQNSRKDGDRIAAFRFESVTFDNNGGNSLPSFSEEIRSLVTLNTIWRDKRTDPGRAKLIVDPEKVFELGIHHLSKPINEKFVTVYVDSKIALLHHYRKCENKRLECKQFIQDVSLWRFYSDIIYNVRKAKQRFRMS